MGTEQETVEQQPEVSADEIIKRTEQAAKRLEEATAKFEKSRLLAEEARAKLMLGGKAEAGQEPVKPTKQELVKEDLKKLGFPESLLPRNLR